MGSMGMGYGYGEVTPPPSSRKNHMIIIIAPAAAAAASPAPPHNAEPPSSAAARLALPSPPTTSCRCRRRSPTTPTLSSQSAAAAAIVNGSYSSWHDAKATHTVRGRPVNTDGRRGLPLKKPSFGRDAWLVQYGTLAQDGARLMTGPFRPTPY